MPEDIALLGFDNRHLAAFQRPPLPTVALPLYEMGKLAGELLLKAIETGTTQAEMHRMPCYLVKRQSC